jgi:hypothetical protein
MIYRLQTTTASLTIPTPYGYKSRMISAVLTCSAGLNQGSIAIVFERGGLQVAGAVAAPLNDTMTKIYFALGLGNTSGLDTGVTTQAQCGLPDIWWDQDVVCKNNAQGFTVTDFTILYEQVALPSRRRPFA